MEVSKIVLPKKIACSKLTSESLCTSRAKDQCIWNGNACTPDPSKTTQSLFDEYIRIVRSHTGRAILEIIAKKLNVAYDGRSIKSICDDIQEVLHIGMHGNTIRSLAKKFTVATKDMTEGEIYYKIYRHIFQKLAESNQEVAKEQLSTSHHIRSFLHQAPITPGYIDFDTDKVVYKNQYKFIDRIEYAQKIDSILIKYTKKEMCDFKKGFEKVKRIGTKSLAGEAYIAYNGDNSLPIYVAIKLMPLKEHNKNEVEMYQFFTKYVTQNISPHFPIMYKGYSCSSCQFDNKRRFKGRCITVFNELAQGDLKSYLKTSHTSYDLVCIFGQLIITCLAMEHAGFVHNDMHWGNYLYHFVPEYKGKYMYYKYFDTMNKEHKVYIKNNGIVFVGWDFADMLEPYYSSNDNLHIDAYRIFHINKWASEEGYPKFPSHADNICTLLKSAAKMSSYGMIGFLEYYNTLVHQQKSARLQEIILIDPPTPPTNIINIDAYELPL